MNSRTPRHTPTRAGAAVHRPAPATASQVVAAPLMFSPNAALLIDFDNVTMGIRSDLQTELKTLLASDIIKGKVQLRRAYADWRRYPQYVAPLAESSIDMIMAPAYGSSKKNATDIRLAIDALELVFTRPEIGTYILLSGDSDFSTLVIKLKEYGKYVIGVGIRESSSDLLVMNCDEYYSYNALAGLVRTGGEDEDGNSVRRDPWELVSEALARMVRNGDVMRADRLKQVMQDIDSTFDEKNLGMSKFSRFVQEAAQRGLVTLSKMENGQLEIGVPRPGETPVEGSPASPAVHTASDEEGASAPVANGVAVAETKAHSDREERARRGRRGRGRGRDREARPSQEARSQGEGPSIPATPAAGATPVPPVESIAPSGAAAESGIGSVGERLTRDEAFDLVRRAVAASVNGDEPTRASDVRNKAFQLLGRDSESLSERNFARILRDAHDADVVDLRRRGDDYEVGLAVSAAPVTEQLNAAAAAHAPVGTQGSGAATGTPSPALPRGLGVRGARRGGAHGRGGTLPPDLLSVGVVGARPAVSPPPVDEGPTIDQPVARVVQSGADTTVHAPAVDEGVTTEADESTTPARRGRGGRSPAKRGRPRTKRAPAPAEPAPRAKRGRNRAATKSSEG